MSTIAARLNKNYLLSPLKRLELLIKHRFLAVVIVIGSLILLSSDIGASSIYAAPFCSSDTICILIVRFGPNSNGLASQITEKLTNDIADLLKSTRVNDAVVRVVPLIDEVAQGDSANQQIQSLARRSHAQFIIWGGVTGVDGQQSVHIKLNSFLDLGEVKQLRPTRVQTFFYDSLSNHIGCPNCRQLNSELIQHLRIVAHTVVGLTAYVTGQSQPASESFIQALLCDNESYKTSRASLTDSNCRQKLQQKWSPALIYYYAGKTLTLQGDYAVALELLDRSANYEPREPAVWVGIGQAYQSWLNEPDTVLAVQELNKAAEHLRKLGNNLDQTQRPFIDYDLGLIAELLNEPSDAQIHFQRANDHLISRGNPNYDILIALARIQQKQGRINEASHTLKQASHLEPQLPWAFLSLAKLFKANRQQAQGYLQQAKQANTNEPYVDIMQAELCEAWQDYQCAMEAYEAAIQKQPLSGWLHGKVGDFYTPAEPALSYQSWPKAQEHYGKVAYELRPNDPWAHERLAYVLSQQGNYREAVQEYERALQLAYPDSAPARLYCNLSVIQEQIGLYVEAQKNNMLCSTKQDKLPEVSYQPQATVAPS